MPATTAAPSTRRLPAGSLGVVPAGLALDPFITGERLTAAAVWFPLGEAESPARQLRRWALHRERPLRPGQFTVVRRAAVGATVVLVDVLSYLA